MVSDTAKNIIYSVYVTVSFRPWVASLFLKQTQQHLADYLFWYISLQIIIQSQWKLMGMLKFLLTKQQSFGAMNQRCSSVPGTLSVTCQHLGKTMTETSCCNQSVLRDARTCECLLEMDEYSLYCFFSLHLCFSAVLYLCCS